MHSLGELQFDDSGNIIGMIGTTQDTTESKEQEIQLRHTQKMDALDKLTGGIAHDYNNMLGVILGYSTLLKEELCDQPTLLKYVGEIIHAGERSAKLTKKLLGFSRKKNNVKEKVSINKLLQNEQHMLEKTLTARIQMKLDLSHNLWPVLLDASELEDAIVNLSINAMHAIEGNGILTFKTNNKHLNIEDAVGLDLKPGDYSTLSISDTGNGIDADILENIFEPFFSTKGEKGTGLGLAQVYGFIMRSNGSIKVTSNSDHGSCFELYFPRCFESSQIKTPKIKESVENLKGNESILLVDDEPALLKLTQEMLQNEGYQVSCAQSGKEALYILKNTAIDLLVSDIIMPGMDGNELAATVKEIYPSIHIQLVSGYSGDTNATNVKNDLQDNLLFKPLAARDLLLRIRGLLNNKGL